MMYDCSGAVFRNLKNPYTGKRMLVKMLVAPATGATLFAAPGEYAPSSTPVSSPKEAFRMWDRRDGVEGARAGGAVVCAWTGAALSPERTDRGWVLAGGFDPTVFRPRDEFLYYAEMRDGKSPRKLSPPARAEQPPPEPDQPPRRCSRAELSDDAVHTVEGALKASGGKVFGSVSLFGKRRR